jgi:hypothetical protein
MGEDQMYPVSMGKYAAWPEEIKKVWYSLIPKAL